MANIRIFEPIGAGTGTITAGIISSKKIRDAAKEIKSCLANISPTTPSCCIDGRYNIGTLAEINSNPVGPKPAVAGGANLTAYAAAEMVGDWFDSNNKQSDKQRLIFIDNLLYSKGIIPGTHSDENAIENSFKTDKNTPRIGCGFSDNFTDILKNIYKSSEIINRYTNMLIGKKFNPKHMYFVDKKSIQDSTKNWNPINALNLVSKASDGKNVEILQGSHAEVFVIFNFIKDVTLDRFAFSSKTDIQAFVIDMWYINKLAHAMASVSKDQAEMFSKLKHAMIAFQIAAYLTLCDGTQRPIILTN
ncbi:hypothetical protein CVV43_05020 [Candidatus Saccharibacteria bacterium HGW-Saccharibacteria-1]|jgi:hypothetical protein|nr:MAG: hypothetical protein CVV43_05020 [Candidatus Saccharibacteria bacterium HGW-Saccharibacteria-1]